MEVRVHHDVPEYWALTRPLFAADPMRHTQELTVLRGLVESPDPDDEPPTLLSLWDGARLIGAAIRRPPLPLLVSAVPPNASVDTAAALLGVESQLPGVTGPRDAAEPFAEAWSKLTGATVREAMAMRLFRLGSLVPPTVSGQARLATESDLALLVALRSAAEVEIWGRLLQPERTESNVRRSLALGNASVLWEVDGQAVSYAAVRAPIDGMSGVGPVYTPPELRGHGYGSAVTAAASRWALEAGAEHVVLLTDLANPTSNSIYQRIGYRPVYDQTELEFGK